MPTPVRTARQCLTDEAARALDAAVAIARRRNHTQTTSLHAVSALLSPSSSSLLRYACSRSHSPSYTYSPRFQFRALELCIGVSLDRLPTSKTPTRHLRGDDDDDPSSSSSSPPPPVSNSLMAAIKRSQGNQRRQPDMYQIAHLHHHNNPAINPFSSISMIKVELKNLVVSILDDPIVSRVLGEAGFRSNDIKLAILCPPVPPPSSPAARFLSAAAAAAPLSSPLFSVPFPFAGSGGCGEASYYYYYCRRIGEILVKRSGSGRNPLLVGVCAGEALASFKECMEKRKGDERMLPSEVSGLGFVCLEKDIEGFVAAIQNGEDGDGGMGNREKKLDSKFEELRSMLEKHAGPGLVVSYGDLKVFLADDNDGGSSDAVKYLVSKLSSLVELFREKMWLIGSVASCDTCKKFLGQFPSLEEDWDLQSLPVTSSRTSVGGFYSKPSFMGSFVPFGGFFSSPPDFRNPLGVTNQPFTECALCNEKYNQELSTIMKGGSSVSVADKYSSTLPSWLRMTESRTSKPLDAAAETKNDETDSNAEILGLQKKWNDICKSLHHVPKISNPETSIMPTSPVPCSMSFLDGNKQGNMTRNLHSNDRLSSSLDSSAQAVVQNISSQRHAITAPVASFAENSSSQSKLVTETSKDFPHELDSATPLSTYHSPIWNLPPDHKSPSSVSSETTDLGLGSFHAPTSPEPKRPNTRGPLEPFSGSVLTNRGMVSRKSTGQSDPHLEDNLDKEDYKQILKKLTKKVPWQVKACQCISQIVSSCRSRRENELHHPSTVAQCLWISLVGPDKMGKKRVAQALASAVFGSRESLIAVDLSSQERASEPNSMFDSKLPSDGGVRSGRKTVVDYLAEELRKRPHSVVFLENVDQADDLLVRRSLSRAIQTDRLPDSHGREISVTSAIFLMTCSGGANEDSKNCPCPAGNPVRFPEERILREARTWQMKIVVEHVGEERASRSFNHSTVLVAISSRNKASSDKRKLSQTGDLSSQKKPRCLFDLNFFPLEEADEAESIEEADSFLPDPPQAWWVKFQDQAKGKVGFKPFDFDVLAKKLLISISLSLEKRMGIGIRIEIDQEVMIQMLGAVWCSDKEGAMEYWIEEVLGESFAEAQKRYSLEVEGGQHVLKLVPCPGIPFYNGAPAICLPRSINLGG